MVCWLTATGKVDRFAIPLGAPLSVIVLLTDDGEAQAMNDLIAITNIRNSNIALTRALNYAESLNEYVKRTRTLLPVSVCPRPSKVSLVT